MRECDPYILARCEDHVNHSDAERDAGAPRRLFVAQRRVYDLHVIYGSNAARYARAMKKLRSILDVLIEPLAECLSKEDARRVVSLKPSREFQTAFVGYPRRRPPEL
jgi:hypothetical protein